MGLSPQAAALLADFADTPPIELLPSEEHRQNIRNMINRTGRPAELAVVADDWIETPRRSVPVRIYRPGKADGLPVCVFFHGGGWVAGDLDTHDRICRDVAAVSGVVVVAVDYRLAPEQPFPAAYEDCLGVVRRLLEDGAGLDVDPARVAVAGESAGGNLAAEACLRLRGVGAGIAHQVLIFPVTDAAGVGATESYRRYAEGYYLTARDMAFFVRSYAAHIDPADPRVSPLRAEDLTGLPSATVLTAEFDPLRDEGEAYARRLSEAGSEVRLRRFDGMFHPFILFGGDLDDARSARTWIGERLREALRA